jgi:exoribonuclease R
MNRTILFATTLFVLAGTGIATWAQQELAAIGEPAGETHGLRDLRDRLWASIDNDDSRDLDQLTVAESLTGGSVRILVAIADVDALVRKGSAIDGHASRNTTSVYTPAAIFPMLPEALSTDRTSLNEGQDRIALVADMVFETDGSLAGSDLSKRKQFTTTEANQIGNTLGTKWSRFDVEQFRMGLNVE